MEANKIASLARFGSNSSIAEKFNPNVANQSVILVADVDEVTRICTVIGLNLLQNIPVLYVSSGQETIKALKGERFNCTAVDVDNMYMHEFECEPQNIYACFLGYNVEGGLLGTQIAHEVSLKNRQTRIIGYSPDYARDESKDPRFDFYLTNKPCSSDAITRVITE